MASQLLIAADLVLPLDVVSETIAILAKRRSGKSYAARKLVEQLLDAQLQVVVVDPKGDWWGLRSSSDGKRPVHPILIAGGEHATSRRSGKDRHQFRRRAFWLLATAH